MIKAELYKKEIKEKSDVAIEETLSQFSESVSHNWSELLYVDIQFASTKLEYCLIMLYFRLVEDPNLESHNTCKRYNARECV